MAEVLWCFQLNANINMLHNDNVYVTSFYHGRHLCSCSDQRGHCIQTQNKEGVCIDGHIAR